jgi:CBS domain containing-hemolysin-like protein
MLSFVLAVIFLGLAVLAAVLRKTYQMVPAHELKRQAAGGNELAKTLYRAVGFGESLQVLLWIVLVLGSALGLANLVAPVATWLAVVLFIALLWLIFLWLPSTRVSALSVRVTRAATPSIVWLLHYNDSWLQRLALPFTKHRNPRHSGLYELHDLLNLLDLQSQQPDSRISAEAMTIVRQALQFNDKQVHEIVEADAPVKVLALTDAIGPILLDEMHASGQTVFPVKKTSRSKEIIGYLGINDVGIHSTGTVEEYAVQGVLQLNENDTLRTALQAFGRSNKQLAVIENDFEEYVGVLSLTDVLARLVPAPVSKPDDTEAVETADPDV